MTENIPRDSSALAMTHHGCRKKPGTDPRLSFSNIDMLYKSCCTARCAVSDIGDNDSVCRIAGMYYLASADIDGHMTDTAVAVVEEQVAGLQVVHGNGSTVTGLGCCVMRKGNAKVGIN